MEVGDTTGLLTLSMRLGSRRVVPSVACLPGTGACSEL
jgi:hypothetical protein